MKSNLTFVLFLVCTVTNASKLKRGGFMVDLNNFDDFKSYHNKSYLHQHDEFRSRLAFQANEVIVREHNRDYQKGATNFRLRANIMADMTSEMYLKMFLRLLRSIRSIGINIPSEIIGSYKSQNTPEQWDWREHGFITKSTNQRNCGSCYAFSIAENIGGQVFKRTGKILEVSVQQIIDCSITHGNHGCTGGSLRNTLKYLADTGGIMRESDYKYVSKKNKCQFVPELSAVNITSWVILPTNDEKAIEAALVYIGPISVSIDATPKSFQLYSDGIFDDDSCSSRAVNHAMLVIGYDKDFWILKNWWGKLWGEDGYMRLRKGCNLCGIANYAAYAVI